MSISRWAVRVCLVLFLANVGLAEEPPGMPQPTAEHAVLGQFVGEWAGKGDLKESPMGPGGEVSWTEKCAWFGGAKFNVVCKSEGSGPMGPMKGLGIMGYHPDKKVYTHYGVDSTGWSGFSEGTRDGDSFTFESEETMGGQTFRSRFTMTMESPTRMTFTWQTSMDGKEWTTMMEGVTEKK